MAHQPHWDHQFAGLVLGAALLAWSRLTRLGVPNPAPGLIFSFDDDVAPDLLWISNERLARGLREDGKLYAAPELVVEILSPGSTNERRDRDLKPKLYAREGVDEYWLVDYRSRTVEVFRRAGDILQSVGILADGDSFNVAAPARLRIRSLTSGSSDASGARTHVAILDASPIGLIERLGDGLLQRQRLPLGPGGGEGGLAQRRPRGGHVLARGARADSQSAWPAPSDVAPAPRPRRTAARPAGSVPAPPLSPARRISAGAPAPPVRPRSSASRRPPDSGAAPQHGRACASARRRPGPTRPDDVGLKPIARASAKALLGQASRRVRHRRCLERQRRPAAEDAVLLPIRSPAARPSASPSSSSARAGLHRRRRRACTAACAPAQSPTRATRPPAGRSARPSATSARRLGLMSRSAWRRLPGGAAARASAAGRPPPAPAPGPSSSSARARSRSPSKRCEPPGPVERQRPRRRWRPAGAAPAPPPAAPPLGVDSPARSQNSRQRPGQPQLGRRRRPSRRGSRPAPPAGCRARPPAAPARPSCSARHSAGSARSASARK